MSGSLDDYLSLITSEHSDKPKFIATVTATIQPLVDAFAALTAVPPLFDIDTASGAQLDVVGQWVGRSRYLSQPLTGVYFSFETAGVGFDQGTWLGPNDPTTGMVALPDEPYRTLLKAVIAANDWDGTIPQAYEVWSTVFDGTGISILIQDGNDMTMLFALFGGIPDAVTLALLTGGYIVLRPAGVQISAYMAPSVADTPYFGFDYENNTVAGFDYGAWGTILPAT